MWILTIKNQKKIILKIIYAIHFLLLKILSDNWLSSLLILNF